MGRERGSRNRASLGRDRPGARVCRVAGQPITEGMTHMFENHITITGNVCNDPEVRLARSGEEYAAFRVASDTRRRNSRDGPLGGR